MRYLTSCVDSTAEKINALVSQARDISYQTARRAIGAEAMDAWAKEMSYDTGSERGGLRLKNDWHVSYHRSVYDGMPCVYIRHSAIEHIFVEEAKL